MSCLLATPVFDNWSKTHSHIRPPICRIVSIGPSNRFSPQPENLLFTPRVSVDLLLFMAILGLCAISSLPDHNQPDMRPLSALAQDSTSRLMRFDRGCYKELGCILRDSHNCQSVASGAAGRLCLVAGGCKSRPQFVGVCACRYPDFFDILATVFVPVECLTTANSTRPISGYCLS